jgi:CRISPR system Cascade subunit CasE
MWLSKLTLNSRNRAVRTDLRDCHELHRTVMRLFSDLPTESARENLGVLYRVEQTRSSVHLLLQSFVEPDFGQLPAEYAAVSPESKAFGDSYEHITSGRRFQFRLRANPTRSVLPDKDAGGLRGRGKRVELRGEEACQDWIRRKAEQHGFRVAGCRIDAGPPDPRAIGGKLTGRRKGATLTVATVLFDGLLEVSDPPLLIQTLHHGIGRAKSYGQGLLSLATPPIES